MNPLLAPSILSADFTALREEIAAVERGGADVIHIDVMDGRFVPNITVGVPIVRAIRGCTRLPLDVHLMIVEPSRYIEAFRKAGADWISLHVEAEPLLHRTLSEVRRMGAKAGVVLNPGTPVSSLEEAVHVADYVLVMSVEPGFGGQEFIESSHEKIRMLKGILMGKNLPCLLEVDGGVTEENCRAVVRSGADVLVAGSAVFGAPRRDAGRNERDPEGAARRIKAAMRSDRV